MLAFMALRKDLFQFEISDIFHIFTPKQRLYPQLKKNVYPYKPHFSLYKVGLSGSSLHGSVNVTITVKFLY